MSGLHAAFVVCAVLAAVGVVTALMRGTENDAHAASTAEGWPEST